MYISKVYFCIDSLLSKLICNIFLVCFYQIFFRRGPPAHKKSYSVPVYKFINEPISNLKLKVSELDGGFPEEYQFMYGGNELKDDALSLYEYGFDCNADHLDVFRIYEAPFYYQSNNIFRDPVNIFSIYFFIILCCRHNSLKMLVPLQISLEY